MSCKLTSSESRLFNRLKRRNAYWFSNKVSKSGQGLIDKGLIKLTDFGNRNYELTDLGKGE